MSTKSIGKTGVFYFHSTRKWIFRIRDKWGRLSTSKGYANWSLANDAYQEAL